MFDPLIEEHEKQIAELKVPVPHVYEIVKASTDSPPVVPAPSEQSAPHSPSFPVDESWVRPGFLADQNLSITLWAENPLLAKPIQINFDPQGRLWVASSSKSGAGR